MLINKNSWHYKWWYLTYKVWNTKDIDIPSYTNLCSYVQRLFWMTLITTICWGIIGIGVTTVVVLVAVAAWHHPWGALSVVGGILAFVAAMVGFLFYLDSETRYVVNAWVGSKTQGICPIINFTNEPKK